MMWARNVEFMLGCWLGLSPFIFRVGADMRAVWVIDAIAAAAIALISLASYWPGSRKLHLLNGAIGLLLALFAFAQPLPATPAHQNYVVLGLLLALFSIVPNEASRPPEKWRYVENGGNR